MPPPWLSDNTFRSSGSEQNLPGLQKKTQLQSVAARSAAGSSSSGISEMGESRCDWCGSSEPAVRCNSCMRQIFCLSCDDTYHRHPKREMHVRRALAQMPARTLGRIASISKLTQGGPVAPPRRKRSIQGSMESLNSQSFFDTASFGPASRQNSEGQLNQFGQAPVLPKKQFNVIDKCNSLRRGDTGSVRSLADEDLPPSPPPIWTIPKTRFDRNAQTLSKLDTKENILAAPSSAVRSNTLARDRVDSKPPSGNGSLRNRRSSLSEANKQADWSDSSKSDWECPPSSARPSSRVNAVNFDARYQQPFGEPIGSRLNAATPDIHMNRPFDNRFATHQPQVHLSSSSYNLSKAGLMHPEQYPFDDMDKTRSMLQLNQEPNFYPGNGQFGYWPYYPPFPYFGNTHPMQRPDYQGGGDGTMKRTLSSMDFMSQNMGFPMMPYGYPMYPPCIPPGASQVLSRPQTPKVNPTAQIVQTRQQPKAAELESRKTAAAVPKTEPVDINPKVPSYPPSEEEDEPPSKDFEADHPNRESDEELSNRVSDVEVKANSDEGDEPEPIVLETEWLCDFCTYINQPYTKVCEICCKSNTNPNSFISTRPSPPKIEPSVERCSSQSAVKTESTKQKTQPIERNVPSIRESAFRFMDPSPPELPPKPVRPPLPPTKSSSISETPVRRKIDKETELLQKLSSRAVVPVSIANSLRASSSAGGRIHYLDDGEGDSDTEEIYANVNELQEVKGTLHLNLNVLDFQPNKQSKVGDTTYPSSKSTTAQLDVDDDVFDEPDIAHGRATEKPKSVATVESCTEPMADDISSIIVPFKKANLVAEKSPKQQALKKVVSTGTSPPPQTISTQTGTDDLELACLTTRPFKPEPSPAQPARPPSRSIATGTSPINDSDIMAYDNRMRNQMPLSRPSSRAVANVPEYVDTNYRGNQGADYSDMREYYNQGIPPQGPSMYGGTKHSGDVRRGYGEACGSFRRMDLNHGIPHHSPMPSPRSYRPNNYDQFENAYQRQGYNGSQYRDDEYGGNNLCRDGHIMSARSSAPQSRDGSPARTFAGMWANSRRDSVDAGPGGYLGNSSFRTLEELVEKRRQMSQRNQGREMISMLREAELQNFTAEEVQIAINNCGSQNPITWLQENWKTMVETVVSMTTSFGMKEPENDIGIVCHDEAKKALRLHKGNVWAAVTECVEQRRKKFAELNLHGNFSREEIIAALATCQGDVDRARIELGKQVMKPFMMRIWGPPAGVENQTGAPVSTTNSISSSINSWLQTKSELNIQRPVAKKGSAFNYIGGAQRSTIPLVSTQSDSSPISASCLPINTSTAPATPIFDDLINFSNGGTPVIPDDQQVKSPEEDRFHTPTGELTTNSVHVESVLLLQGPATSLGAEKLGDLPEDPIVQSDMSLVRQAQILQGFCEPSLSGQSHMESISSTLAAVNVTGQPAKKDFADPKFSPKRAEAQRKVRRLLAEKKVATYAVGESVIQLLEVMPEISEHEAVEAITQCRTVDAAMSYLRRNCTICGDDFPMSNMVGMVMCEHQCCRECARLYFTQKIMDCNVVDFVCFECKEPNLTDDETANDYFSMLDIIIRDLVSRELHDMFQNKLFERTMQKDPNFVWCIECPHGFLAYNGDLLVNCIECACRFCRNCKTKWEGQHAGLTCEEFRRWKRDNDPDENRRVVDQQLEENGLVCPKCEFKFEMARGGCMHFHCTQCRYDFCVCCGKQFLNGTKCNVNVNCAQMGFHAHHPRNCYFYLRDKDPEELQKLLDNHGVDYNIDEPNHEDGSGDNGKCPVMLTKEVGDGLVDEKCGDVIEAHCAGMCAKHYIEYLSTLIYKNGIDSVDLLDKAGLLLLFTRSQVAPPVQSYMEEDADYVVKLVEVVKEKIPLEHN